MDWSAWIPERLRTTICSKIPWSSWDTRGESTHTPNAYIYISRNRTLDEWSRWYIKKIGINFLDKWGVPSLVSWLLHDIEVFFILRTHSRTMILSGVSLLTFLYYLLLICFVFFTSGIAYTIDSEYETEVKAYLGRSINTKTPLNM